MSDGLHAAAASVILETWQPALDELLEKNSSGLDDLDADQQNAVNEFVKVVIAQEKEQFREIFVKFHNSRTAFARQYQYLLRDLSRLLRAEGEYALVYALGFKGMTPDASQIANRIGIAVVGWKLSVMRAFFERNWGEDIARYSSTTSGPGCRSQALVFLVIGWSCLILCAHIACAWRG